MSLCSLGWHVASPAMLCRGTGTVAICPAAPWLAPERCPQPQAGTLNGMLGRFASREHPAAGRAGRQGMLQAHCARGAHLGTGHGWEPQGSSPRTVSGIAMMSIPWQAHYAFIKTSGHHHTTDGCFAADRQCTAVAHF